MKNFLWVKITITIVAGLALILTPTIILKINKQNSTNKEYENLTIDNFLNLNENQKLFIKYKLNDQIYKINDENDYLYNNLKEIKFTNQSNKTFDWLNSYSHIDFYNFENNNGAKYMFYIKDINIVGIYYYYHESITQIDCVRYYSISEEDSSKINNCYNTFVDNWINNNAN